jgi:hypothetical protein
MVFCLRAEGVLSAMQSFLSLVLQGHDQTLADRLQNLFRTFAAHKIPFAPHALTE